MDSHEKTFWKAGNLVAPAPAALVTCLDPEGGANLMTVAWCGNINTNPPMVSISIRPERHSYEIISRTGEFVVNLPSLDIAGAVDYCGVASGRKVDKFAETGLTPFTMEGVACPGVAECPINIACRVANRLELGSHSLFLATVEGVAVNSRLIDGKGRFHLERGNLLCYAHGDYYGLGNMVGHFGWSVRKKKPGAKISGSGKAGKKRD